MSLSSTIHTQTAIARLQYISQQQAQLSHQEAIHKALDAGCDWIQLRIKEAPDAVVRRQAAHARELCNRYKARLIINDYPDIAREVEADGLHLGLTDMPVSLARLITGTDMLIGGTANTWQDIQQRVNEGVDYIGLGPLRFTATKQKLSPLLGIEGYTQIVQQAAATHTKLPPIIAIGGVTPADIPLLQQAGVHGIAVSGVITNAPDAKAVVQIIHQAFNIPTIPAC